MSDLIITSKDSLKSTTTISTSLSINTLPDPDHFIGRISRRFSVPMKLPHVWETLARSSDWRDVFEFKIEFDRIHNVEFVKSNEPLIYFEQSKGFHPETPELEALPGDQAPVINMADHSVFSFKPMIGFDQKGLVSNKKIGIPEQMIKLIENEFIAVAKDNIESQYSTRSVINLHKSFLRQIESAKNQFEPVIKARGFASVSKLSSLAACLLNLNVDFNIQSRLAYQLFQVLNSAVRDLTELVKQYFSFKNELFKLNQFHCFLMMIFINEIDLLHDAYYILLTKALSLNFNYPSQETIGEERTRAKKALIKCFLKLVENNSSFGKSGFSFLSTSSPELEVAKLRRLWFQDLLFIKKELTQQLDDMRSQMLAIF